MSIQSKSSQDSRRSDETNPENVRYAAPVFENIRKDIGLLQSDVASLASDIKQAGADKTQGAVAYVNEKIDALKDTGANTYKNIEGQIQSKPGQSITIAFVAGLLASYLFSRRQ